MRLRTCALAILLASSMSGTAVAAPFTVNTESDFNVLLASLLGTTSGLSNISGSVSGDPSATGLFTGDPFGLGAGVVLSTGMVTTVLGPNDADDAGTDFGPEFQPGDTTTLTITFDSDATVEDLFFQYVFGSEEFFEFIGDVFNDSFTLSLDGTNFALLQCGDEVAINNFINDCADELVDNTGGTVTQLDAFTNALIFAAPLTVGSHTLVMSIVDVGDGVYDSAVFIQGQSLGTEEPEPPGPAPIPEPAMLSLLAFGLAGLAHRSRRLGRQEGATVFVSGEQEGATSASAEATADKSVAPTPRAIATR